MNLFKKATALILAFVMMFSAAVIVSAAEKTTSLKITVAEINWTIGKSSTFKPVVTPAGASTSFAWSSSNPKVATISQSGKLTAVSAGTTTITCKTKDGSNLSTTCKVNVYPKTTSLNITVDTIKWPVGKSSTFKPAITPENAMRNFTWSSSNPAVATVSQAGKLTAVGAGTTIITCKTKDGTNLSDFCTVIVSGGTAKTESVNITVDTIKWPIGKSSTFKPVVTPANAPTSFEWTTSDASVATISQTGKLTAVSDGVAIITCKTKDGTNLSDFCTVIVGNGAVKTESVNITVDTINWTVGRSSTFKPVITPAGASTKLEWTSSNEAVATISETGKLTAVGEGTAIITCKTTDGTELSDSCKVNVSAIKVNKLQITVDTINWNAGKSATFKPIIEPSNAANKTLLWKTTDESVATITQEGKLTAISEGTAIISCETTDGSNLKASCTVNVTGSLTKSVNITVDKVEWIVGRSSTFKPEIEPSNASTRLIWTSSNPFVATVTQDGKLTAVSPGKATITCKTTDGTNLSDSCEVVVGKAVSNITLNKTSATYFKNKTDTLQATVSPSDAMNKNLTWTSSNASVVTVDQTGKITTVSEGTATITCKATDGSGKSATCKITVAKPVESVSLNFVAYTLAKGKTVTLKATVKPTDATNKNVTWTSSDTSVATVSSSGVVTALKGGTAVITCKAKDGSDVSAKCTITVAAVVEQITFSSVSMTLEKGTKGTLKATALPSDATNKNLVWQSMNPTVATVSSSGEVTAKRAGTATIICKSTDGSKVEAYAYVLVTDQSNPSPKYNYYFNKFFYDGTYTISGTTMSNGVAGLKSEVSYGTTNNSTNANITTSILGVEAQFLTIGEDVYLLIPYLQQFERTDYYVPGGIRLFDNLIYVGSKTEKINGKSCTVETFEVYGVEGLTMDFCFRSTGNNLDFIRKSSNGEEDALISGITVRGTYDSSLYTIPSDYTETILPEDEEIPKDDEEWGEVFG